VRAQGAQLTEDAGPGRKSPSVDPFRRPAVVSEEIGHPHGEALPHQDLGEVGNLFRDSWQLVDEEYARSVPSREHWELLAPKVHNRLPERPAPLELRHVHVVRLTAKVAFPGFEARPEAPPSCGS